MQSSALTALTDSSNASVYFFLAFKESFATFFRRFSISMLNVSSLTSQVALTVLSSLAMIRLLRMGQFWILRPVRVARGTILVPKATDATIFLGAIFIIVDAAYRFKSIQWWRGPTYEPMRNFMLLEGLRLFPAWLAAWVHLCASSLVWPLKLEKLRPLYWHLVFFGLPCIYLITFIPFCVLGDRELERGQAIFLEMERELLAAPNAPVTQSMQDRALSSHAVSTPSG